MVFGIGLGCSVALGLPSIVPTRGGPSQIETARKPAEKPATKSSAVLRRHPLRQRVEIRDGEGRERALSRSKWRFPASSRPTRPKSRSGPRHGPCPWSWSGPSSWVRPLRKEMFSSNSTARKSTRPFRTPKSRTICCDIALKQAAEELPLLEKSLPVDLAAAERSKTQVDEDLKKFLDIDRSQSERNAQFAVKRSTEYLEYSKEELRQLEKMYRSKDLTEETEEIIFRRQRFQVETSEFFLKEAELHRDQVLKIDLPRQEQRMRENAVKQAIDLEKARAHFP